MAEISSLSGVGETPSTGARQHLKYIKMMLQLLNFGVVIVFIAQEVYV